MTKKKTPVKKAKATPMLGRFTTWYVIGYVVLVIGVAVSFWLIDREAEQRQAFDDRRAYELCLSGNDAREAIRSAFGIYTNALIHAGADEPRTPEEEAQRQAQITRFRAVVDEGLEPLGPRKCVPPG